MKFSDKYSLDFYTVLFGTVCIASVCVNIVTIQYGQDWGDDFAMYIMQARALVSGTMQHLAPIAEYVSRQSTMLLGPKYYPWGFPTALSLVFGVFGENLHIVKLVNYFTIFSATLLYVYYFGKRHDKATVIVSGALMLLSPVILLDKNRILSDFLYTLISLGSVILFNEFLKKQSIIYGLSAVLLATVGSFTRSVGFVVVVSYAVTLAIDIILRRNDQSVKEGLRRHAAMVLLFILVNYFAKYFLYSYSPDYGSHIHLGIGEYCRLFFANAYYYASISINLFFPFLGYKENSNILAGVLFCVVTLFGMVSDFEKSKLFAVYVAINMMVLCFYPFREGYRFLLPVSIIILYYFCFGVKSICNYFSGAFIFKRHRYMVVLAMLIVSVNFMLVASSMGTEITPGPFNSNVQECYEYVRKSFDGNACFLARKPRAFGLFTGMRASYLVKNAAAEQCSRHYLFVTKMDGEFLRADLVKKTRERNTPVFSTAGCALYEVEPEDGQLATGASAGR